MSAMEDAAVRDSCAASCLPSAVAAILAIEHKKVGNPSAIGRSQSAIGAAELVKQAGPWTATMAL
jgi:hypothetical protein